MEGWEERPLFDVFEPPLVVLVALLPEFPDIPLLLFD